jgi:hypothetical protein
MSFKRVALGGNVLESWCLGCNKPIAQAPTEKALGVAERAHLCKKNSAKIATQSAK